MQKKIFLLLTLFLFAVVISGASYANGVSDIYVSPDGNDVTGTGTDVNPYETVGKGIDAAAGASPTVHMAAGTYDQDNGGVSTDYGITITKDVTIQGAGKDQTFIDAGSNDRIFSIDNGYTVTLKDLTILNGLQGLGGAISNEGTLILINCNFKDNTAASGGAIYNTGTTSASNCLFENNEALPNLSGGAIYTSYGSSLTVTGSTFTKNKDTSNHGGAIYASYAAMLEIIGNNFLSNTGNAIYIEYYRSTNEAAGTPTWNINFNRIVGNTPYGLYIGSYNYVTEAFAAGSNIINTLIQIDATNNWWGSNNDPRTLSNAIYDPMNYADTSKWLVLKIGANPNSISFGSTSLVTASVIYNNLGEDTSSIGHIPDGAPITITTDIGNVGSKSVTLYTVNGIVTTIFKGNDGLGTAHIYAILDGFKTPLPALVEVTAAASSVSARTVEMQATGTPVLPLFLAVLLVVGGIVLPKREN